MHEAMPGMIELDYPLLSKILTEYAHNNEHMDEKHFIEVESLEFDEETENLIAHVVVFKSLEH